MELVEITRQGLPKAPIDGLPDFAGEVGAAHAALYEATGFEYPWIGYFAVVDGCCVGACGFKGPPVDNQVELAYFTFPGFEHRGFATRMARELVALARQANPGLTISAQTLPAEGASTAILQKLGFELEGVVNHPDDGKVWAWYLEPTDPM